MLVQMLGTVFCVFTEKLQVGIDRKAIERLLTMIGKTAPKWHYLHATSCFLQATMWYKTSATLEPPQMAPGWIGV